MRGTPVTDSGLNQSLHSTLSVLTKVGPADLDAPTPCASWDVRALVNHFVGSARWWAAVAGGADAAGDGENAGGGGFADFADFAAGGVVAAYEESIRLAVAAFAVEGALDKTVLLPFGEFPGAVLRDLAATEQFVHGWDLARAIGYPAALDPELASWLLGRARLTVTEAYRGPDGQALFGPAVEAPAGAGPADQLAAFLGRRI